MNYHYTACCWFPTSSNILILPSQFWQIRFESCWLHCSKCRTLVLLRTVHHSWWKQTQSRGVWMAVYHGMQSCYGCQNACSTPITHCRRAYLCLSKPSAYIMSHRGFSHESRFKIALMMNCNCDIWITEYIRDREISLPSLRFSIPERGEEAWFVSVFFWHGHWYFIWDRISIKNAWFIGPQITI